MLFRSNRKLHGILRVCDLSADVLHCTRDLNIPVVGLHTSGPHDDPLTVSIDWRELVRLGVESLAKQGCKSMGLITPFGFWRTPHSPRVLRRGAWDDDIKSFQNTLVQLGIPYDPSLIWEYHPSPNEIAGISEYITNEERGYHAFKALFTQAQPQRPEGLLILDDTMTKGAISAAQSLNIKMGTDVRIATHSNLGAPALRSHRNRLTLLEVSVQDMVELMFQMLEQAWNGAAPAPHATLIKPSCSSSSICSQGATE